MHFSALVKWEHHTDHADTQVYIPFPLFSGYKPFGITSWNLCSVKTSLNCSSATCWQDSSFTGIPCYPQFLPSSQPLLWGSDQNTSSADTPTSRYRFQKLQWNLCAVRKGIQIHGDLSALNTWNFFPPFPAYAHYMTAWLLGGLLRRAQSFPAQHIRFQQFCLKTSVNLTEVLLHRKLMSYRGIQTSYKKMWWYSKVVCSFPFSF